MACAQCVAHPSIGSMVQLPKLSIRHDDVIIGAHMAQMIKVINAKAKAVAEAIAKGKGKTKCALKANNNSSDEHKINLQTFDGFIGTHNAHAHTHNYTHLEHHMAANVCPINENR